MSSSYQDVSMTPNKSLEDSLDLKKLKRNEELKILLWQYENNRSITTGWHHVFLIAYIFIGTIALLANGLVVWAVFRNKKVSEIRSISDQNNTQSRFYQKKIKSYVLSRGKTNSG